VAKYIGASDENIYIMISAPLFLFCFLNPAVGGFTKEIGVYLLISLPVFLLLIGSNILLYKWLTGKSAFQTNSIILIYLLMLVFFFMAHSAGFLFRGIKMFLEKTDQMR